MPYCDIGDGFFYTSETQQADSYYLIAAAGTIFRNAKVIRNRLSDNTQKW